MTSSSGELESFFNTGLNISKNQTSNSHIHPRFDEFKCRLIKSGDQDHRRKKALQRQKANRFNAQQYARKLADGDPMEDAELELSKDEDMEKDETVSKSKKSRSKVKRNPYKNQLMLSEWMIDKPEDLEEYWVMVVCPTGRRTLVVAHKGTTTAYTKSGHAFSRFPSLLPGGSFKSWRKDSTNSSAFTILDCIYDEVERTYWMIDLICYNGTALYDSETDFRFFWLTTKLMEECPNIHERSSVNPNVFRPCPHVPCMQETINETLSQVHSFKIDGLLFYHRLCHYQPGRTPLVGWLKPFMLPEILQIPVPPSIMEDIPVEFNRDILKDANEKLKKTISDRSFNNPPKSKVILVKMDT